ncbi:MAG: trypsin-like peptidase domain-containing protein [Ignavibacteriales bacterium]|nr:trypsin-like peptidase domain-containing protein [Ignavibacteriales bacterium]MCB9259071.1 trypsin-like peptidase domain-containing protein [Ignavibacteriales bacterium]
MNKFLRRLLTLLIFVVFLSCSRSVTTVNDLGLIDGKYDSDFVQISENKKLDELVNSVKMLNCIAYYESYTFSFSSNLKKENLSKPTFKKIAISESHSTETASGTATIIYSDNEKAALLTCAHIIDFPDTLITFFKDNFGKSTDIIESISIKTKQTNLLPEYTFLNKVEILAVDNSSDIAVIGSNIKKNNSQIFNTFKLKAGNAEELTWGTKVYMLGFPLNYKMITSGIVSPFQEFEHDYFLVDAVFNRGFSGGIVLAIRDGAPNFEIVGMIKSGTVHKDFKLKPKTDNSDFVFVPQAVYKGEVIVEQETDIKYGITKILTINKILDVLNENSDKFNDLGYRFDLFFN